MNTRFAWSALLLALTYTGAVAGASEVQAQTGQAQTGLLPSGDNAIASAGASATAPRAIIQTIAVEGNQRIEASTIRSYLGVKEGSPFNPYDIDTALKALFATGFFADATAKLEENGTLRVKVIENPVINRIAFEGNHKLEDGDLDKELELRPRAIFTRTKLQNDVKRVLDIYRRGGRYSATVEPKVITLDQNRIDLVFEIQEGKVATVQKIQFVGNSAFDSDTLRKAIRTEEERWYRFFTSDDKYDPDRLLFDQELLRRFYASNGYPDFQVKAASAELSPDKEAFFLSFAVEEGRQYSVGKLDIASKLKGVDAIDFKPFLNLAVGDTYNATEIENTVDALVKTLGDKGFAFVDIDPVLKRHPETNTIDVTFNIKEGPRVYVERINIVGNVRTLDEVIRREFRVAEGDAYSTSKISRSEQRLNNLGFFEKVKISNTQGSAPDKTVINVEVQEKSTGEINIGAGFSTQDGALADFGVRESNLLGRGQDLRFRVQFATERQQYDIGFTEPYFLGRELSAGFDLFRTQQDFRRQSSFDREANGGSLRIGYALTEKLQHSLNYTYRETTITNVQSDASRFIRDQEGTNSSSSIGQAFTYENRNNRFDPTDGYYFRFAQDLAGLGGDARNIRHEVKAAYYYPIAKQWTFSLSGTSGHIQSLGRDVRINDRFFIGGDDLRGFERAGIGPRDVVTQDALGGNTYYTASTELKFPLGLPEDLGFLGAAFVDVGSLWDIDNGGPGVFDSNSPRVSVGLGIAWTSPFGPIRVNFAEAVIKEDLDEPQIFSFSFGTRF